MPTTYKDYYQILGVPKTAAAKDIKAAFRKLARKYHPDVNQGDPQAEARFKEINEANEVLSDPEKRRKYDEIGADWQQYEAFQRAGGAGFPGAGFGGPRVQYRTMSPEEMESLFGAADPFSDFFYSMFGQAQGGAGVRGRAARRRGEDVEGETSISLEEAYHGATRTVELDGSGRRRRVEVAIPAGIREGARVRAAGQGGSGSGGGAAGDLYMRVHIEPHPRFAREGDNVRLRFEVPLKIALLGGDVHIPTLKGGKVSLAIPPETQNGRVFRLRGLGMPKLGGGGQPPRGAGSAGVPVHGDLLAEADVRLPLPLTSELKEWAEKLPD
jgi:DnaJ-class molecular chaperone